MVTVQSSGSLGGYLRGREDLATDLSKLAFWSGQFGQDPKHSPRTIGSEVGYLTVSMVQSRRDGLNVQDVSPG
jgi:hypothetical protein